jgi:hypothetical protein
LEIGCIELLQLVVTGKDDVRTVLHTSQVTVGQTSSQSITMFIYQSLPGDGSSASDLIFYWLAYLTAAP